MTVGGAICGLLIALCIYCSSRRVAAVMLLLGACYLPLGEGTTLGGFNFPLIRILILAGFLRVLIRKERPVGGLIGVDKVMLLWATCALVTYLGHEATEEQRFTFRLGLVYNGLGLYFLFRTWVRDFQDAAEVMRGLALVLVPLAFAMAVEKVTHKNLFACFGGVSPISEIRDGRLRAVGPFAHPILAGTVGAACIPVMVWVYRISVAWSIAGVLSCFAIVLASTSSGPLLTSVAAIGSLLMWRRREYLPWLLKGSLVALAILAVIMKAPVWYLLGRIDLTGSSTGWHRAELIDSSIRHLGEWWLCGTDYTRHWMPTGVSWSPNHTDITNHYIKMGVLGGLPLLFLFICSIILAFRGLHAAMRRLGGGSASDKFLLWVLGCTVFCHAVTFISVSYFDQSIVFWYFSLAIAATLAHATARPTPDLGVIA